MPTTTLYLSSTAVSDHLSRLYQESGITSPNFGVYDHVDLPGARIIAPKGKWGRSVKITMTPPAREDLRADAAYQAEFDETNRAVWRRLFARLQIEG